MRVKVGSVAFLAAAGSDYGIGLTDDGHLLEWIGPWDALAALRDALAGPEPVYVEVEDWQVLAVDEEVRLPLSRKAMAERARFREGGTRARRSVASCRARPCIVSRFGS